MNKISFYKQVYFKETTRKKIIAAFVVFAFLSAAKNISAENYFDYQEATKISDVMTLKKTVSDTYYIEKYEIADVNIRPIQKFIRWMRNNGFSFGGVFEKELFIIFISFDR